MPQVTYNSTSPYFNTGFSQFFLDVMTNRPIVTGKQIGRAHV